jgi:RNA polymerase sigma-70 factor (ECF subfamily)
VQPESDSPRPADVDRWIAEARGGSREALNRLLEVCRSYLLLAANQDLAPVLRGRVAPSDVVQETLLEAARDFPTFRGGTEAELLAWMRRILQHNLANEHRRNLANEHRSLDREVPLAEAPAGDLQKRCLDEETPRANVRTRERDEALERALAQLPDNYRRALLLRSTEELTFAQIGERLGCSAEAARKLWSRAAEELARLLGDSP